MQHSTKLYPLKFKPILKPVIWGGADICKFKNIQPLQDGIGESWEVSDVKGNVSVVANGTLEGKPLDEILAEEKGKLIGEHNYERFGTVFPLLIKFIDARDDLSIQVHPDDTLAKKRHNSFGKTEMWYVVKATPGASLYSGFAESITPDTYVEKVKDNTFTDTLKKYAVQAGDVFFLPAGRVHAIGAGCFIAEIQQTSDITYRIYDYNRKDAQGKGRELHTELAKDSIDFKVYDSYKTDYVANPNNPVELVSCPYFTTTLLDFDKKQERNLVGIDSFVIYICMEGSCTLSDDKGNSLSLGRGETVLVPATAKSVSFAPQQASKLLETYVE
ncbi:MAG: class I mannose-6-phosphate isomerase [Dysgonamonadaceae bacterium]|jgi:mannose-6-phosphate isomerase|nr:class I mannose-6-phosphate isomerase [Dysgonamonadaceae bacterium]